METVSEPTLFEYHPEAGTWQEPELDAGADMIRGTLEKLGKLHRKPVVPDSATVVAAQNKRLAGEPVACPWHPWQQWNGCPELGCVSCKCGNH